MLFLESAVICKSHLLQNCSTFDKYQMTYLSSRAQLASMHSDCSAKLNDQVYHWLYCVCLLYNLIPKLLSSWKVSTLYLMFNSSASYTHCMVIGSALYVQFLLMDVEVPITSLGGHFYFLNLICT